MIKIICLVYSRIDQGVNNNNRHTHKPIPGHAVELSRIKLFHTVKLMMKVPEYCPFNETLTQITSELLYLRMMPKKCVL